MTQPGASPSALVDEAASIPGRDCLNLERAAGVRGGKVAEAWLGSSGVRGWVGGWVCIPQCWYVMRVEKLGLCGNKHARKYNAGVLL